MFVFSAAIPRFHLDYLCIIHLRKETILVSKNCNIYRYSRIMIMKFTYDNMFMLLNLELNEIYENVVWIYLSTLKLWILRCEAKNIFTEPITSVKNNTLFLTHDLQFIFPLRLRGTHQSRVIKSYLTLLLLKIWYFLLILYFFACSNKPIYRFIWTGFEG